jgi:PAS domain S-box-containing protein
MADSTISQQPLPFDRQTERDIRSRILRFFFGTTAVVAALAAMLYLGTADYMALGARLGIGLWFVLVCAASAGAMRLRRSLLVRAMLGVSLMAVAGIGLATWWSGSGINSPAISFLGLLTCMVCVSSNRRNGLAVGLACGTVLALLALGELQGWVHAAGQITADGQLRRLPLHARLPLQLLAVASGYVGGVLIERIVQSHLEAARDREQRFRTLLSIAADAYFETDATLHLRHVWRRGTGGQFTSVNLPEERPLWDLPTLSFEPAVQLQLREAMRARESFRELPARLPWRGGLLLHLLVSGQPRLAADGSFVGYWGLVRDVTREVSARQALAETETRYRDLFDRVPTPLVLHDDGRILAANPAAAQLLEFDSVQAMTGRDLKDQFTDPDDVHRVRHRLQQLASLPPGQSLPPIALRIRTTRGRSRLVLSTGVRVSSAQGPLTLTMYVDETERRAAEAALQRSRTLLQQVVQSSPDAITLSDMATGRYEMTNPAFVQMLGFERMDEVLGHTAFELNVWPTPAERQRLVDAVQREPQVRALPMTLRRRDGRLLSVQVSATRMELDGRQFLVTTSRDMSDSERSRLEREAILDNASIGIAFTRDRRFALVNQRFEQMFGWPPGSLLGQPARAVWPSDEDYSALGRAAGPVLSRGEQAELERLAMRRDGSTFLARLLAKAIDPANPAERGTIWIVEDITERRATQEALARARDAAEAANQAKSAFLANTSHEIRTPLNGLVGLARLARAPNVDPGRRQQYLDQIGESAEALSAIISDILDLSKIEAGKLQVETVPFDLHELLTTLHHAYAALADARGLQCALELDPALPLLVRGDPLRTRQVLANYLSNGLKFTQAGGLRLLARPLSHSPGRLRFEVHDTGQGIPAELQSRLFQPFTQVDQSTTRRFGGTGLGLSICRELAHLMGGEVGASSTPGVGSCFWVELPLPEADLAGQDSGFAGLDPHEPLQGAKVLLVEDNPVNMMIGVAMLEQWGAQVHQATDGVQAVQEVLRAARSGEPTYDVVLMDLQMPGMGGLEATRLLRAHFGRGRLGIVALTAAALVSEREASLAAGMDGFVTKPIDEKRLHDTLTRVLAHRAEAG